MTASLGSATERLADAAAHLAEWYARQTSQERSYVTAGHDCIAAIDATLRALYDIRTALTSEIRTDEIERNIRVDQLLAQLRAERYERENPVTNERLPGGVEGRPLGRHGRGGEPR